MRNAMESRSERLGLVARSAPLGSACVGRRLVALASMAAALHMAEAARLRAHASDGASGADTRRDCPSREDAP